MNANPLFEAIANCAVFFETASSEVLDPDDAVRQLEDLAFTLRKAEAVTRHALAEYFKFLALREDDPSRRRALNELPDGLGLIDDDDRLNSPSQNQ